MLCICIIRFTCVYSYSYLVFSYVLCLLDNPKPCSRGLHTHELAPEHSVTHELADCCSRIKGRDGYLVRRVNSTTLPDAKFERIQCFELLKLSIRVHDIDRPTLCARYRFAWHPSSNRERTDIHRYNLLVSFRRCGHLTESIDSRKEELIRDNRDKRREHQWIKWIMLYDKK